MLVAEGDLSKDIADHVRSIDDIIKILEDDCIDPHEMLVALKVLSARIAEAGAKTEQICNAKIRSMIFKERVRAEVVAAPPAKTRGGK